MKKEKVCIVNIIANDYLPQQTSFIESLRKQHGEEFESVCVFLEKKPSKKLPFKSFSLDEITNIKDLEYLKFKYDILELSTAVKPFIISWLFEKYHFEKILYFDSDIIIYKRLDLILDKLNAHDVVITPHIRKPIADTYSPNEIDFAKSGYFNAGFFAFKNNPNALKFLDWWASKTELYCFIDFEQFYFVDQRWLDYAPIFLNAHIIKEAGYNVAYFNLQEYIGHEKEEAIHFIHFSGFNKDKVSSYQNRFTIDSLKSYAKFYHEYERRISNPKMHLKNYKYAYNYFGNGIFISQAIKNIFKNSSIPKMLELDIKRPFDAGSSDSIYQYLITPNPKSSAINLLELLYLDSPRIQSMFPLLNFFELDIRLYAYIEWFIRNAEDELGIDRRIVNIQRKCLYEIRMYLHPLFLKLKIISLISYIKVLSIKNKALFLYNIYPYLLQRRIDKKTLKKTLSMSELDNREFKKTVISSIIESKEFDMLTDQSLIKKHKYKILTSLFLT